MATVLMEYDQVCDNCIQLIANGEAWENHEDVSHRTAVRQEMTLGRMANWLVMACPNLEDETEHCTEEVIGACDTCGHQPADGYWWGHKAALVYGNKVKVEGIDHPARIIAGRWQSPGRVGNVLAQFASTGEVWVDDLMEDMEATRKAEGPVALADMDRLHELVIEALKEGE